MKEPNLKVPELYEAWTDEPEVESEGTPYSVALPMTNTAQDLDVSDPKGYAVLGKLWSQHVKDELGWPPEEDYAAMAALLNAYPTFLGNLQPSKPDRRVWLDRACAEVDDMHDEIDDPLESWLSRFQKPYKTWRASFLKGTSVKERLKAAKERKKEYQLLKSGDEYTGFTALQFALAHFAEDANMSLRHLSGKINKNPSYLFQFVAQGTPKKLDFWDAITLEIELSLEQFTLCDPHDVDIMTGKRGFDPEQMILDEEDEHPAKRTADAAIKHLKPFYEAAMEDVAKRDGELGDIHKKLVEIQVAGDKLRESQAALEDLKVLKNNSKVDPSVKNEAERVAVDKAMEMNRAGFKAISYIDDIIPLYKQLAVGQVSEVDAIASAGPGQENTEETVIEKWRIPQKYLEDELEVAHPGSLRIITIKGDSMEPTLMGGDKVMVDMEDTNPSPAGIFIVWDGGGCVCKRIERVPGSGDPVEVNIMSDNTKYTPYSRTLEEAAILGRVKWLSRKMS